MKSNEELRSELREFISALGFPDDHVPSTKELTDHGRFVQRLGLFCFCVICLCCKALANDLMAS